MVLHKLYYSIVQRRKLRVKVQKQPVKELQAAKVSDRAPNFGFCLLVKCYFRVLASPSLFESADGVRLAAQGVE